MFKVWANRNQASLEFLQQVERDTPLPSLFYQGLTEDKLLGWTYSETLFLEEQLLRATIHRMLRQFMGRGPTKGRTFEWIPNHLQDTNGEIVPRSILDLFALAAKDELENSRAKNGLLLSHLSIRTAIEEVSKYRITELVEEYPWLEDLRPHLESQEVPMSRHEFESLLAGIDWQNIKSIHRPLRQKPSDIVDHLLKIGILRLTSDHRIHVPDIYLYGFKMKRRGGIKRALG